MAKIKMGTIVTDISGKLGGNVFAKNKAGAYVRRKSTISNPQTVAQMLVRGRFAQLTQAWRSLTDVQRASWIDGAENFRRLNIFGDSVKLSGKALFQSLNQNLLNFGLTIQDVCPTPADVPSFAANSASLSITDNTLDFNGSVVLPSDVVCVVEMTSVQSAGKSFMKNAFRQVYFSLGNPDANELYDAFVAKFGVPAVGDNIGLRYYTINSNGQASPKVEIPLTVLA